MDKITAVGLDLAKQIIQVHAIDAAGRVVLRKVVRRERLLALLAQFPRCVVGMEACSGAHHWARELTELGHDTRIMAAEFVRPFRKSMAAKNALGHTRHSRPPAVAPLPSGRASAPLTCLSIHHARPSPPVRRGRLPPPR
jgi:transposase